MKMIQNAIKQEQSQNTHDGRLPTAKTNADTEGALKITASHSASEDRFKFSVGPNAGGDPQDIVLGVNLANQKHQDDRLTVNAFNQANTGALQGDMPNYRNQTHMVEKAMPNMMPQSPQNVQNQGVQ